MVICVVGDSHAESFRGVKGISTHIIGRATAYNLIKDNSTSKSKQKTAQLMKNIHDGSYALFTLGEIDCRVHIYHKYMSDGEVKPIEQYIQDTVDRYIEALKQYKGRIIVCTIPPAGYEGNSFKYPFYGTPEIRGYINKTFNIKLVEACKRNDIPYVDVFDKVVLPNNLAKKEYLKDEIHFNNKAISLILEELKVKGYR